MGSCAGPWRNFRIPPECWSRWWGTKQGRPLILSDYHSSHTKLQDSENNTILMLLADHKPPASNSYSPDCIDMMGAALRMARLYYDRYFWIMDWSNVYGKTALHIAALKGNEELVRVSYNAWLSNYRAIKTSASVRCCATLAQTTT